MTGLGSEVFTFALGARDTQIFLYHMEKIRHKFILLAVGKWLLHNDWYLSEKTGNVIVIDSHFRYGF
jgi:hypothetical protein